MARTADSQPERGLLERLARGPVSGSVLAHELGLTRAAVWKRIDALRDAGVNEYLLWDPANNYLPDVNY